MLIKKHVIFIIEVTKLFKGVGEGGARASPLSKVGGTSRFVPPPPTFGQSKCSNFTICSYFVVTVTSTGSPC